MSSILSPEVSVRAVHLLAARCLSSDPPLRFEIRRRDYFGAAAGVYKCLPSQQANVRSRGGDVKHVIAARRIGAAWANALDPSC